MTANKDLKIDPFRLNLVFYPSFSFDVMISNMKSQIKSHLIIGTEMGGRRTRKKLVTST